MLKRNKFFLELFIKEKPLGKRGFLISSGGGS